MDHLIQSATINITEIQSSSLIPENKEGESIQKHIEFLIQFIRREVITALNEIIKTEHQIAPETEINVAIFINRLHPQSKAGIQFELDSNPLSPVVEINMSGGLQKEQGVVPAQRIITKKINGIIPNDYAKDPLKKRISLEIPSEIEEPIEVLRSILVLNHIIGNQS